MRIHAGFLSNCSRPVAGPAWPASRQRASAGRARRALLRRSPPRAETHVRIQQPRPLLELRARQRGRLYAPSRPRTSVLWCSAGAPMVTPPPRGHTLLRTARQRPCRCTPRALAMPPPQQLQAPRRRALLNSASQRPCGCWLSARATAVSQQQTACGTAHRARTLRARLMARSRPALLTALLSLAALLATARAQVGHAACPWQCY
jgi:hypothetical protein